MDSEFEKELQGLEITRLNERAENAVAIAAAAAGATGAIPIPFADAPLLIGEQVALMGTICGIYGIDIGKDGLKMLATTAIGAGGATIIGKTIATNLLKLIPGAGSIAGGVISAGTAGLVTLAMGKAFIEVCKAVKLGKLSEADLTSSKGVAMMKSEFKNQVKANKDVDFSGNTEFSDNANLAAYTHEKISNDTERVVDDAHYAAYLKTARDRAKFDLGINAADIRSVDLRIDPIEKKVYSIINGEERDVFDMYDYIG